MKLSKNEPTFLMFGVSFVVAFLAGWQILFMAEKPASRLIQTTSGSWLEIPTLAFLFLLECAIVVFIFWLGFWLAHRWADAETKDKASDN